MLQDFLQPITGLQEWGLSYRRQLGEVGGVGTVYSELRRPPRHCDRRVEGEEGEAAILRSADAAVRRQGLPKGCQVSNGKKSQDDLCLRYKWVSHLTAEEESTACCTEDIAEKGECEGAEITPWCPGAGWTGAITSDSGSLRELHLQLLVRVVALLRNMY